MRSRKLRTSIALAVAGGVGAGGIVALPAAAAPGQPFDPEVGAIYTSLALDQANTQSLLLRVQNLESGLTVEPVGDPQDGYKAVGYHADSGFIFGFTERPFTRNGWWTSIASDGAVTQYGIPSGVFPDGTDMNGVYIAGGAFGKGAYANTFVFQYFAQVVDEIKYYTGVLTVDSDGNPLEGSYKEIPDISFTGGDLSYSQGYYWALSATSIVRIDPTLMTTTIFPRPADLAPEVMVGSGGAWTFPNGNLGFMYANIATGSGRPALQLKIDNPGSGNPTFTLVGRYMYPGSNAASDATFVGLDDLSTDLQLVKSAPATVTPGSTITYTLEVTNNSATDTSSGSVITDTLPAGLTNVQLPEGCLLDASDISCNVPVLAPNAVHRVEFTAQAPSAPTTVTNNATLIANEDDPDLTNNISAATTEVLVDQGNENASASAAASADADPAAEAAAFGNADSVASASGTTTAQAAAQAAANPTASTDASADVTTNGNAVSQVAAQAAANSVGDDDTAADTSADGDVSGGSAAQAAAIATASTDASVVGSGSGANANVNENASASAAASADADPAAEAAAFANADSVASAPGTTTAQAAAQAAANPTASTDASADVSTDANAGSQAAAEAAADVSTVAGENASASAAATANNTAAAQAAALTDASTDASADVAGATANANTNENANANANDESSKEGTATTIASVTGSANAEVSTAGGSNANAGTNGTSTSTSNGTTTGSGNGKLASTGSDTNGWLVGGGITGLLLGLGAFLFGRRRKAEDENGSTTIS